MLANGLFWAQEYLKYSENNKESKRLPVYYSKANLPCSHVTRWLLTISLSLGALRQRAPTSSCWPFCQTCPPRLIHTQGRSLWSWLSTLELVLTLQTWTEHTMHQPQHEKDDKHHQCKYMQHNLLNSFKLHGLIVLSHDGGDCGGGRVAHRIDHWVHDNGRHWGGGSGMWLTMQETAIQARTNKRKCTHQHAHPCPTCYDSVGHACIKSLLRRWRLSGWHQSNMGRCFGMFWREVLQLRLHLSWWKRVKGLILNMRERIEV